MRNKSLNQLYQEHEGKVSDKWSSYLNEYDRLFDGYRDVSIRLLEIGIQNGGSLEIWSSYFPQARSLVGCDINPACDLLRYEDNRIEVVVGDANDASIFDRILQNNPEFDIIIDDGSHESGDIVKSFCLYFQRLADGGVFVVEDMHCSYWKQFEGGLFYPYSSMTFFKRLADVINHEHWGVDKTRADILNGTFSKYDCRLDDKFLSHIHSVEFINSMCVIRKRANIGLGHRIIAGSTEFVVPGHKKLNGIQYHLESIYDQSNNDWSNRTSAPDEVISEIQSNLDEANSRIVILTNEATEREINISVLAKIEQEFRQATTRINSLTEAVSARDDRIVEFVQSTIQKEDQISNLKQRLLENIDEIQQLRASTSWRVTKPIRVVKSLLMRIGNLLIPTPIRSKLKQKLRIIHSIYSLIPDARKYTGGFKETITKIGFIFKNEGLDGVKRRIAFLQSRTLTNNSNPKIFVRGGTPGFSNSYNVIYDVDILEIKREIDGFVNKPLISVIIPTYNPNPDWLNLAIESVRNQIYPYWELCIADDASTDPNVRPVIQRHANQDSRIKFVFREINGNISAASNSAMELVSGDYVALLDHDDELTSDALYWNAKIICSHPESEIIYSDEDKISPDGELMDVFYKPDWSPELMFNCMYMGHLTVYKKSLIDQVGGFRSEFDFSQDYDLALRATEVAVDIRHIPHVLYHWRQAEGSAAQKGGKPYARVSNLAALQAAVDRRGIDAKVVELPTANRVKVENWRPKVSIVVPTDSEVNLTTCLNALLEKTIYSNWEIVVVTNSTLADKLEGKFNRLPLAFCKYDKPYNFSDKCNEGASYSTGEIVIFYNDDVRPLSGDWLENLIEYLTVSGVGAVAPKLIYEDHRIQHAGLVTGVRGLVGTAFHCLPEASTEYFCFAQSVRNVSAVSGACFAMRRQVFIDIGGFDAINTPIMHSDIDLSFKVREAGLRCVYTPHATLLHIGHQSLVEYDKKKKQYHQDKADIYLLKRWGEYLTYDPYFTDSMRGLLYHDSPELIGSYGKNRPELVKNHPDILIVTHDLSNSGAPMVAYQIAKQLLLSGAFPVIASPVNGPMLSMFNELDIPVIIDSLLLTQHKSVVNLAKNFDCVLANTVVTWPIVYQLLDLPTPVMWYLHESHLISELAEGNDNVASALKMSQHIYAGSKRSAFFCEPYNKNVKVLNYGVPDILGQDSAVNRSSGSMIFSVFASIEPRKGQDIFLEAIRLLDGKTRGLATFNIVGRTLDSAFEEKLRNLSHGMNNVYFYGGVDHVKYLGLLRECDVVVCPSRDDTLPLVTLDALRLGKTLICTNTTGTSDFMTDGFDGVVVPNADSGRLARVIQDILNNPDRLSSIGIESRKTFLRNFNLDRFSNTINIEVRRLIGLNA